MSKLSSADEFVLDNFYQKFSDFCQKHFGLSCFTLAHISLVISCALYVGYPVYRHFAFQEKINELPMLCLMMFIYVTIYISQVRHAMNYRHGFGNSNRISGRFSRLFMVAVTLINLVTLMPIVRCLDLIMYTSSLYFIACVPRPPQKSTVRQFLENLVPAPAQAEPVKVRH